MKKLYDMAECESGTPRYEAGAMVQTFTVRGNKVMGAKHAAAAVQHAATQFKTTLALNGVEHYAWPPSQDMNPHGDFRGLQVTFRTLCSEPKNFRDLVRRQ